MTALSVTSKCALAAAVAVMVLVACGRPASHVSSSAATSSVHGHVTAGPTCPVERVGNPCPPRAVVARVDATAGTRVVASTRSAADGSYRLDVPSGSFVITATPAAAFPRCSPRQVQVDAARNFVVDISCDTGIR